VRVSDDDEFSDIKINPISYFKEQIERVPISSFDTEQLLEDR